MSECHPHLRCNGSENNASLLEVQKLASFHPEDLFTPDQDVAVINGHRRFYVDHANKAPSTEVVDTYT